MDSQELDRRARLRRLIRGALADCRRYGATSAQIQCCRHDGDPEESFRALGELRDRLLREAMAAPRRAA